LTVEILEPSLTLTSKDNSFASLDPEVISTECSTHLPSLRALLKLFGGDYGGHPGPAVFTIRVEDKSHPVTSGVEDYEIYDEQHMMKYYLDREHQLLRSIARNNKAAAAGWWREMGKGRLVYLSMGHTPDGFQHPMTQRLVRNSMRWRLRIH
jgi:type 1 glutamine amidotransferase